MVLLSNFCALFQLTAYSGHCMRVLKYFVFSFSARLTCDLLNWNCIIERKAETTQMAKVLIVLFRGFSRWVLGQHTTSWVATILFRDTHTHTHTVWPVSGVSVPKCHSMIRYKGNAGDTVPIGHGSKDSG
jgi:hypothetical protein